MSELIKLAKLINGKIKELDELHGKIEGAMNEKCSAQSNYDKELAMKMIALNNGKEFKFFGETVKNPPATITEKIAKGLVYESRMDMELAENAYKAIISRIDSVKTQLNGYQSINRYLAELERGDT